MREIKLQLLRQPRLRKPVLIEGLPGLGLVGKLAAEHLIKQLGAQKAVQIYSPDFPPQVMIEEGGLIRMRRNEIYAWRGAKAGQSDLLVLVGDDQGLTVQSQYAICGAVLDYAAAAGTQLIYTLGGYGTGRLSKEPKVYGAVTHPELIKPFKKHGVLFERVGGSIVGAAGLFLGLGALRGMRGICLMGETHGNYVDPRAARNVLDVVCRSLNIQVNLAELEAKAREIREMISKLEAVQKAAPEAPIMPPPGKDEHHVSYIR